MSGVTGAKSVSRDQYLQIVKQYEKEVLNRTLPGFIRYELVGSFVSRPEKSTFNDIDIIVVCDTTLPKPEYKRKFIANVLDNNQNSHPPYLSPFTNPKYKGRMHYNSGEIVTLNYCYTQPECKTVQIDNIFALSENEATFKQHFLSMPAEKQGLILGLVKVISNEKHNIWDTLDAMGSSISHSLARNEEFEFNLNSSELQLRVVGYDEPTDQKSIPHQHKQISKQTIKTYKNWNQVEYILHPFDLSLSFDELLNQVFEAGLSRRSRSRIAGVFNSMVTVKSGEVGTEKAKLKIEAADKISKLIR